jgi:phenylalanine-4-hydroxylase
MVLQQEKRQFYQWTPDQHEIWNLLYSRQLPRIQDRTCRWYQDGHARLGLQAERVPDGATLDRIFQQETGWELLSTDVQYSDGQSWFEHLIERKFLITEYIRDRDSLDYTPLPDIFHDVFGHLPMQVNKRYADLTESYAHLMLECPPDMRPGLGSIWWYTIEFGIIREEGKLKAFGTGLMSSHAEFDLAFSDRMIRRPFNPVDIAQHKPSPHAMHTILWVMEDFDQLEEFVARQRQLLRVNY